MPTIRATTTSALTTPCADVAVLASRAALTGASASPKPSPASTSGMLISWLSSECAPQCVIHTKPTVASAMPPAQTTPAGSRRVRNPPATAPTGIATSSRSSTSAAISCEVLYVVSRA